ncbi:uncharacterized protein DUF2797 [Kordia periserrulae]|uniref:Uncharacterized protein DUF2797 n=1 Tax=Kordia periserrulae TaxID=701523 RepID=A0A2T6C646_9FLAO|nr:DUF2797 domain-containing protein [Kordia periserrulae]PTX63788.1 uncharacterized protein DUF2797 [Kordia periserrulae]
MMYKGVLTKMQTEFGNPIQYYLNFEDDFLNMNQLLDKKMSLTFEKFECLNCHLDKEIYRQGFCKSCFFEIPTAGDWIMRPELSTAHLGIEDRDLEYEKQVQLQPHIVYLALSSEIKVGVTRKRQVPTRWIDQGAVKAVEILEAPNRYIAGITEVALKAHVSDKTNWRKMLQNLNEEADLVAKKEELKEFIPDEAKDYYLPNREVVELDFPVLSYPEKIKSLNLLKTPTYEGILKGIKGQYLIFEDNTVFNIRGNEGLVVSLGIG